MKITPKDVTKIATLARLHIDDDRLEALASQFNDILDYMDLLGKADTEGVEPLYSPVEASARMREDEAHSDFERSEILANAPDSDGSHFIVPKIV